MLKQTVKIAVEVIFAFLLHWDNSKLMPRLKKKHVLDSMVHVGVINISVSAGTIERQVVKM